MATSQAFSLDTVEVGGAQIHLTNVQLGDDLTLDEMHLEGGNVRVESDESVEGGVRVTTGETLVRVMVSEVNANHLLEKQLPTDGPARNVRVAFLSGKARVTGQVVKVITLPFTVEAIPKIDNGVRIRWEIPSARIGIGLPAAVVELLEKILNEYLTVDLKQLPVPIWLDTLVCEPGRLSATGKARIQWPVQAALPTPPPFSPQEPSAMIPPPPPPPVRETTATNAIERA